jgi:hypothetical protein
MSTSPSARKSRPSTASPPSSPLTRSAPRWPGCAASTTGSWATAGAPGHPKLDCAFESICETCSYFQTSIEFRPTLQAQHDDAIARHQDHRGQLFASLLARLDQDAS